MDSQTKDSLVSLGDSAFLSLSQQIQHMLDHVDFYTQRYPAVGPATEDPIAFKHEQLRVMVETLGGLPYRLADEIRRWKHDEPRILSRMGVELDLLNEIWITLEVTMIFFMQEDMDLEPYNRFKAERAFKDLVRVNKLIP